MGLYSLLLTGFEIFSTHVILCVLIAVAVIEIVRFQISNEGHKAISISESTAIFWAVEPGVWFWIKCDLACVWGLTFFAHHVGEGDECTTFCSSTSIPSLCLIDVKIYESPEGFASYTWWWVRIEGSTNMWKVCQGYRQCEWGPLGSELKKWQLQMIIVVKWLLMYLS